MRTTSNTEHNINRTINFLAHYPASLLPDIYQKQDKDRTFSKNKLIKEIRLVQNKIWVQDQVKMHTGGQGESGTVPDLSPQLPKTPETT